MALQLGAAREDVEAVERQPDRRVVGAPHHLPGVAVIVDVTAPGQRLEADLDAALAGALAELAEVGGGAIDAALRVGRDVAADHHQVAAELAHQVELALGAREGAAALRLRHALEIAERLECDDLQAERGDHARDVARRAVKRQQIAFENFHAGEARGGDRFELFGQSAAERNRCDRGLHGANPVRRKG